MNESRQWAIVVILLLSITLGWLVFEQSGRANPIRDALSRVISPVQFAVQRLSRPASHALSRIESKASLYAENESLRQENAALRSEIVRLREAQIENESLRSLLSFKSTVPTFQLLSAEVIGHDPDNLIQSLIVDRGALDGIELGMPVLDAEGLVGRISEVSAGSSRVMLITDPSSSVSAQIQRSRATGMIQGLSGRGLVMQYLPQESSVEPGDMVLTSGLGGNFPKRLVLGQVVEVTHRDVAMFQQAVVAPAVNIRSLEAVMVLLNFTPIETGTPQDE